MHNVLCIPSSRQEFNPGCSLQSKKNKIMRPRSPPTGRTNKHTRWLEVQAALCTVAWLHHRNKVILWIQIENIHPLSASFLSNADAYSNFENDRLYIIVSVFCLPPPALHPIVGQAALDKVESPKPNFSYFIHFSSIGLSEPEEVKLLWAYCWVPDKMRERWELPCQRKLPTLW